MNKKFMLVITAEASLVSSTAEHQDSDSREDRLSDETPLVAVVGQRARRKESTFQVYELSEGKVDQRRAHQIRDGLPRSVAGLEIGALKIEGDSDVNHHHHRGADECRGIWFQKSGLESMFSENLSHNIVDIDAGLESIPDCGEGRARHRHQAGKKKSQEGR
jgi:hypothetical protein